MIKVSFIVPMFNAANTIKRLLVSLSRQGLAPEEMEAIIIDDASTDGSPEKVEALKVTYPFIRLIRGGNLGPGGGRNIGMEAAQGQYLWFVDADDYLGDGAALVLSSLMDELNLDILNFDFFIDSKNPLQPKSDFFTSHLSLSEVQTGLDYMANHGYRNTVWTSLFRASFVESQKLKFLLKRSYEDAIFMPDLVSRAARVAHYPSTAYAYVRTVGTLSNPKTEQQYTKYMQDSIAAVEDLLRLREVLAQKGAPLAAILEIKLRQETFLFFAMLKMRFLKKSYRELSAFHRDMLQRHHLPLRQFGVMDYKSVKFRILKFLVNRTRGYACLIKIYQGMDWCKNILFRRQKV